MRSGITMLQLFVSSILIGSLAQAAATDKYARYQNKCSLAANELFSDFYSDVDGQPVFIDKQGLTHIFKRDAIVSRVLLNGGSEKITYKVRKPKFNRKGAADGYETVQRTVMIKREKREIVSIEKEYDVREQIRDRMHVKNAITDAPYIKSAQVTFKHSGSDCSVDQKTDVRMDKKHSRAYKVVTYDKQACDRVSPLIKQMGSENAIRCAQLLTEAQKAFKERRAELKKEGKVMSQIAPDEKADDSNVTIGTMIQGCVVSDSSFGMVAPVGMMMGGAPL